jgi:Uma2 family endonuclease
MVGAGILCETDRVELIEGEVVAMTPVGPRHNGCVDRANRALVMGAGTRAIVRTQGSVRLSHFTEPEPDLVLLRPRDDFYISGHAGTDDILLIIEIAESSLRYDRRVKARVYAEERVPEYWLADVANGVIYRYAEPLNGAYQRLSESRRGERIAPTLLDDVVVAVEDLIGE